MLRHIVRRAALLLATLTLLSCESAWAQNATTAKKATSPPETTKPQAKPAPHEYLSEKLAMEDMLADLTELDSLLKEKWALVDANGVDFSAEIAALKARVPKTWNRFDFNLEVLRILAKGIDGHMRVGSETSGFVGGDLSSVTGPDSDGKRIRMPFVVDLSGDRYVAYDLEFFKDDIVVDGVNYRMVALREDLPYVVEIDGIPIERWIEAASEFVSKGSSDAVRSRATLQLSRLGFYRKRLGLENPPMVRVKLTSEDRERSAELQLPTREYGRIPGTVPHPKSKLLDGNVGYMWFQSVTADSVQIILEKMPEYKTTNGLVIDLRDNQGGAPAESLTLLAAFLLPPENHTLIAGVYDVEEESLNKGHGYLTPQTPGLKESDIKLMSEFDERYQPNWTPRNRTTPLHRTYVVLTNPVASHAQYMIWNLPVVRETVIPKIYHYEKPVVVLTNHRCFSAGECLAAGLRHLANVTIVGSPSIGGGCSPDDFRLSKTGLLVGFGIRPWVLNVNGELTDGNGVTPDVVVHPDPDYYFGRRDRALEKALEVIQSGEARH